MSAIECLKNTASEACFFFLEGEREYFLTNERMQRTAPSSPSKPKRRAPFPRVITSERWTYWCSVRPVLDVLGGDRFDASRLRYDAVGEHAHTLNSYRRSPQRNFFQNVRRGCISLLLPDITSLPVFPFRTRRSLNV